MSKLTGKIALVTGSGAGIGAAIAQELGSQGATVAVNYIKEKTRAESIATDIKASGGRAPESVGQCHWTSGRQRE